jgi:hypothetical protein
MFSIYLQPNPAHQYIGTKPTAFRFRSSSLLDLTLSQSWPMSFLRKAVHHLLCYFNRERVLGCPAGQPFQGCIVKRDCLGTEKVRRHDGRDGHTGLDGRVGRL